MIAELLSGDLLHLFDVFHDLCHDLGIDLFAVLIILSARLGRDREALRNGKTDVGHLCKVCAFTAEKLAHISVAFGEKIAILFCHSLNILQIKFKSNFVQPTFYHTFFLKATVF